jgi:hypothetical protein
MNTSQTLKTRTSCMSTELIPRRPLIKPTQVLLTFPMHLPLLCIIMIMLMIMPVFLVPRMSLTHALPWITFPRHPSSMPLHIVFQVPTPLRFPAFFPTQHSPMPPRPSSPILRAMRDPEAGPRVREYLLVHGRFGVQVFYVVKFDQVWKKAEELRGILGVSR